MLATATWSSSGRWGTSSIMRVNTLPRLRASASTSVVRSAWSTTSATAAARKGSVCRVGADAHAADALGEDPHGAVGHAHHALHHRHGAHLVDLVRRRARVISGSRAATSTSIRAGWLSTSSIRRTDRGSPTASGATASGKTTVSLSGSTGSSAGISSSASCAAPRCPRSRPRRPPRPSGALADGDVHAAQRRRRRERQQDAQDAALVGRGGARRHRRRRPRRSRRSNGPQAISACW